MLQGVELLYALGAINDQCELTQPLGLQMAEFPLNPMFARMLLLSGTYMYDGTLKLHSEIHVLCSQRERENFREMRFRVHVHGSQRTLDICS